MTKKNYDNLKFKGMSLDFTTFNKGFLVSQNKWLFLSTHFGFVGELPSPSPPHLQFSLLFNIYCWLQLAAAVKAGGGLLWLTFLHRLLCPQVLRGAQLIAVASADSGAAAVEGSSLPPDIQVQYVQLAPVTDHAAAVQVKRRSHMPPKNELLPGTYTNRLRASIPLSSEARQTPA